MIYQDTADRPNFLCDFEGLSIKTPGAGMYNPRVK